MIGSAAVLLVTEGVTVPTCTGEPLSTPSVVTTAVRLPAVGAVLKVTVSAVAVAEVTMPDAPPLNDDRVMGGRRIESGAVDGDRRGVGGQGGGAGGHDRRDGGHLHRPCRC